eukprot:623391-Prymnesium_polylepis.2
MSSAGVVKDATLPRPYATRRALSRLVDSLRTRSGRWAGASFPSRRCSHYHVLVIRLAAVEHAPCRMSSSVHGCM